MLTPNISRRPVEPTGGTGAAGGSVVPISLNYEKTIKKKLITL